MSIIIIWYCSNNFNGKSWAIVGPKESEPPGGPNYRLIIAITKTFNRTLELHNNDITLWPSTSTSTVHCGPIANSVHVQALGDEQLC